MTENRPSDESLRDEFENLGKNLVDALRSAWEAPESRRLREEMTTGLSDLGSTLKREAENLATSPAAQKVQTGVGEVGEKIRSTEVQEKVRRELIGALQVVNSELQKVIDRWTNVAPETVSETAPETAETQSSADFSQPASDDAGSGFEGASEEPSPTEPQA